MKASPSTSEAEPSTETASLAHWPHMTGQAVSDLIGFSPTMLRKLEQQGFVERLEPGGRFDAGAALLGYIRWLRDDARRSTKTNEGKRKETAQALKVEIEIAKELKELVDVETIEETFLEMFTTLPRRGRFRSGWRDPRPRAARQDRVPDQWRL